MELSEFVEWLQARDAEYQACIDRMKNQAYSSGAISMVERERERIATALNLIDDFNL